MLLCLDTEAEYSELYPWDILLMPDLLIPDLLMPDVDPLSLFFTS